MKTITVTVTQGNIDASRGAGAKFCPMERALIDAGYPKPTVGLMQWYARGGTGLLSRRAYRFINRFDGDMPVEPQTFRLKVAS